MTIFLQVLFGFLGGVFGGMGMGGGTLLIPLLVIFLQMEQTLAQGINLMSFLVMAWFALVIHNHNGLIESKGLFPIISGGVAFSILGSILAGYLPTRILRMIFGGFLCLLSIYQFIKVFKTKTK